MIFSMKGFFHRIAYLSLMLRSISQGSGPHRQTRMAIGMPTSTWDIRSRPDLSKAEMMVLF